MLDLLMQDDHLSGAHHRAILTALLAQGQPALALRCIFGFKCGLDFDFFS